MTRRFFQAFAVAAAAFAAFAVVASPALAGGSKCHTGSGNSSAVNIYTQQPLTSGSCGKGHGSSGHLVAYVALPQTVAAKLKHTSKRNQKVLKQLATSTALGASTPLPVSNAAAKSRPPSAVGAAFDLGSGPIALLIALLAAAALLAIGGVLRRGR